MQKLIKSVAAVWQLLKIYIFNSGPDPPGPPGPPKANKTLFVGALWALMRGSKALSKAPLRGQESTPRVQKRGPEQQKQNESKRQARKANKILSTFEYMVFGPAGNSRFLGFGHPRRTQKPFQNVGGRSPHLLE